MGLFEDAKKSLKVKKEANKACIRDALNGLSPRTADLMFDLSRGEKGTKLDTTRRAHVKAIELVSSLLGSFSLPVRPKLQYQGMIRDSVDKNGVIEHGVIKVGVTLGTLMGHKAHIDIPVIVRNKQLVEPAVFFYDDAPYVMCGPALDDLVKRGSLQKETQIRPMFSPPLDGLPSQGEGTREPITNHEHMFSPGARNPYSFRRQYSRTAINHSVKDNTNDPKFNAWLDIDKTAGEPRKRTNIDVPAERPELWDHDVQDEVLDPAERRRDELFGIGADVVLTEDIQTRDRGGGHLIIPSGEHGKVLKDSCGEGKMLQISFPAMCLSTIVPKRFLRSGTKLLAAATINQVRNEVKAMLREGYQNVDIKEAIKRRYPEHADEALIALR